jgi:hypothetical protein
LPHPTRRLVSPVPGSTSGTVNRAEVARSAIAGLSGAAVAAWLASTLSSLAGEASHLIPDPRTAALIAFIAVHLAALLTQLAQGSTPGNKLDRWYPTAIPGPQTQTTGDDGPPPRR